MQTRKSINDRYGERSLYVVEYQLKSGKWVSVNFDNTDCTAATLNEAFMLKEKIYKEYKAVNKEWTRKRFRVRLYVRIEDE